MSPILGLVQAGRKFHEQIMEDACTITRVTTNGSTTPSATLYPSATLTPGGGGLNEATGLYLVEPSTIYAGPCRLVVQPRQPQDAAMVGQIEAVTHARLDLPVGTSTGVRDGDMVTFTASVDPALVGAKYRLRGIAGQTHATARRFFVEA
ncbi:MAG TPA: DUF6093 family protein, partial [Arthrobacter sp.]